MSGDGQLRAFVERILRLKEEQDTLAGDIREVYAEAKGSGFDKTAMGQLVAHLRKVEKVGVAAVEEGQTVFDLYLDAYRRATGTGLATHTHEASQSYAEAKGADRTELEDTVAALREVTRQNGTDFDGYDAETRTFPADREITDTQEQPETASQSEQPETTGPYEYAGTSSDENSATDATKAETMAGFASVQIPHSAVTPPAADKTGAAPLPSSAAPVEISDEDVPAFLRKERKPLRPNCQHPDNCAGYGTHTCHSCTVAAREVEPA